MGYKLSKTSFDRLLQAMSKRYVPVGPTCAKNAGTFSDTDSIRYGKITSYADLELAQKSYFSPKEFVFPIRETLFRFNGSNREVPEVAARPIAIFARPCDINGFNRLDSVFLENGPEKDFYYARRRKNIKFFMIECLTGFESCFCVTMKANKTADYSVALRFDKDEILAEVKDEEFISLFEEYGEIIDYKPEFKESDNAKVELPNFEGVDLEAVFNHPLWKEYTQRCIACGRCNTSCVTCSCFSMQDTAYDAAKTLSERRRVWAGCHIDGFTDMAGGHSFRKNNGDRMRFKTMHKIYDFAARFGRNMCVGCGRCDDVCPEYISFSACINKLSEIIKEMKNV